MENTNSRKISALIITFNEQDKIEAIIDNLSFADEIVVVDSFSTDQTVELVKKHDQVKLIQNKFVNFPKQRNFALTQVQNDWVLFMDADELIPNDLKLEIIDVLNKPETVQAYQIYRQFYFKNKKLRFSGWQTDKVFRLFNKNHVNFDPQKYVHEVLVVKGKTAVLKNKLCHFSFDDYQSYKGKMERYAELRAKELYERKLRPNFYHFYIKPAYRFFNHFFIRLGFLDGIKGYTICKLGAYSVQRRYVELNKLYSNQ